MKTSPIGHSMRLPIALCLAAVVLENVGFELFGGSALYEFLVVLSFVAFVSAFALGSLRSPLLTLPLALMATYLLPHQDCGTSVGVLPGIAIMPSWFIGSLFHLVRRLLKSCRAVNDGRTGPIS